MATSYHQPDIFQNHEVIFQNHEVDIILHHPLCSNPLIPIQSPKTRFCEGQVSDWSPRSLWSLKLNRRLRRCKENWWSSAQSMIYDIHLYMYIYIYTHDTTVYRYIYIYIYIYIIIHLYCIQNFKYTWLYNISIYWYIICFLIRCQMCVYKPISNQAWMSSNPDIILYQITTIISGTMGSG